MGIHNNTRDPDRPGLFQSRIHPQPEMEGGRNPTDSYIACIYLTWIVLAEIITNLFFPIAGLILHGLLLISLLTHSTLFATGKRQKMLIAVSLAPLIRLISLSMPLHSFQPVFWYLLVGAPLFIAVYLTLRYTGFSLREIGVSTRNLPVQALVGGIGLGFGYVEYQILHPQPLVTAPTIEQAWLPAVILIVFTGFLEEIIFRGIMQQAFTSTLGKWRGMFFVSVIFASLHIGYKSLLDIIFVFCVAMIFAIIVQRTDSIIGVSLAHGLTNVALFLIIPFFTLQPVNIPITSNNATIPLHAAMSQVSQSSFHYQEYRSYQGSTIQGEDRLQLLLGDCSQATRPTEN